MYSFKQTCFYNNYNEIRLSTKVIFSKKIIVEIVCKRKKSDQFTGETIESMKGREEKVMKTTVTNKITPRGGFFPLSDWLVPGNLNFHLFFFCNPAAAVESLSHSQSWDTREARSFQIDQARLIDIMLFNTFAVQSFEPTAPGFQKGEFSWSKVYHV